MAIKVGINGYGTIGKRVADAVALQKDMQLVGITGHSYDYKIEVAKLKGFKIFSSDSAEEFAENGITISGDVNNLLDEADIIVDCTPKKVCKENRSEEHTSELQSQFHL